METTTTNNNNSLSLSNNDHHNHNHNYNHQINEIDFFPTKEQEDEIHCSTLPCSTFDPTAPVTDSNLNINTGLHLVTGNTSSNQSVAGDGISPNSERPNNELTVIQAEQERMNKEIIKLREDLNQVTANYSKLQTNLAPIMKQKQREQEEKDRKAVNDSGGGLEIVQRYVGNSAMWITTYEGNHNHPLPPTAAALMSTTASAARTLPSGSMPSSYGITNSNYIARTRTSPSPSSSMATISASGSPLRYLTQTPNPVQQARLGRFQVPYSHLQNQNFTGQNATLLPYTDRQALYNQSIISGLQMSNDIEGGSSLQPGWSSVSLADIVTALTADPYFLDLLKAAVSSVLSNNSYSATTSNNNRHRNHNVNNSRFQGN
ncbi:uncharacterized protein [Rutidosis leptorrhynchoides]|uniref:uncharacterized protein n=1 Tax=Rutidosis leptorrhynchoides TaxID=125765 RepID=UPI003A9A495E